jgi:hypothetical protein
MWVTKFHNHTNNRQDYSLVSSLVICHTTGPQPRPKRFLHLMRSRASSFKWEYPLLSPRYILYILIFLFLDRNWILSKASV